LIRFYFFKKLVTKNFKSNCKNKLDVLQKIATQIEDEGEELSVLTCNECITVVPQSRRALFENFRSWQPQLNLSKNPNSVKEEEVESLQYEVLTQDTDESLFEEIIEEDHNQLAGSEYDDDDHQPLSPTAIDVIAKVRKRSSDEEVVEVKSKKPRTETTDEVKQKWICDKCDRVYVNVRNYRMHLLHKHMNVNKSSRKVTYEQNYWIMYQKKRSRITIDTIDGKKQYDYSCSMCSFKCKVTKEFRNHLVENHLGLEDANSTETTMVEQEWIQKQVNESKFNVGADETVYKCSMCGSQRKNETFFKHHLMEHLTEMKTEELEKPAKKTKTKKANVKDEKICELCHYEFSTDAMYKRHCQIHQIIDVVLPYTELHKCEECQMFFRSASDLKQHSDGHANNNGIMLVPAAGMVLQKSILYKKLPLPDQSEFSGEACGHCGQKFQNENDSKNHVLIHHTRPLICPIDNREFTLMQAFCAHVTRAHPEQFPDSHICGFCNVAFDDVYKRLTHMKTCKAKMYACDHCDLRYTTKCALRSHFRQVFGMQCWTCSMCGKSHRSKFELETHMRSHTKEVRRFD